MSFFYLPEEKISELTEDTIFTDGNEILEEIFSDPQNNEIERTRLLALFRQKADKLGVLSSLEKLIKAYANHRDSLEERALNQSHNNIADFWLELDFYGKPKCTIDNILNIMQNDREIIKLDIKTNLLTNSIEYRSSGTGESMKWDNAQDATMRWYLEKRYKIHSTQKVKDALTIIGSNNSYHPIRDLIDSLEWDGESRIYDFLHTWMKCENTPYTREVSRLIFAGGINRLYNPGCKFDDMPVLIGTKQGEGKSTIVRWLALRDDFFTEVTEIEGQTGMEAVSGSWICEMGELLALTKAKEVEAVKSFLTRQVDKYRKPYAERPEEYPRQCIFIGTTNREQFLTDKSGNRRYYPIKVFQTGYELYKREAECREYIRQCWAEAKCLYDKGELQAVADVSLLCEIRSHQEKAVEDDWRVGAIEKYLADRDTVCCLQIWKYAFHEEYKALDKKTSIEIGQILDKFPEWERGGRKYFDEFGRQRCWDKLRSDDYEEITFDEDF